MFNKNRNCSIYVPLRLFFFRRESGLRRTEHERLRKQAFLCIIFLCLPAPMILSPPFFIERLPHFRRYTIDPAIASTRKEHLRPVLKTANSGTFPIAKITGSGTFSISKTTGSGTLLISRITGSGTLLISKITGSGTFSISKITGSETFSIYTARRLTYNHEHEIRKNQ